MDATTARLERKTFDRAMKEVNSEVKVSIPFVMYWQGALLAKDLVKATGGNPAMSAAKHKKRTKQKIETDVAKLFEPMDKWAVVQKWRTAAEAKTIYRENDTGQTFKLETYRIALSDDDVRRWHKQHRARKGGGVWLPNVGESVAWGGKMLVSKRMYAKIKRDLIAHIGRTKAGWMVAVKRLETLAKHTVRNMAPAWVSRHQNWARKYGSLTDTLNANNLTGHIIMGNDVPWARNIGNMLRFLTDKRIKDLEGHAMKRLDGIMRKRSAGVA